MAADDHLVRTAGATGLIGFLIGQWIHASAAVPIGVANTAGLLLSVAPVLWLALTKRISGRWGKRQAITFLWLAGLTFVYFLPVWTGIGLDAVRLRPTHVAEELDLRWVTSSPTRDCSCWCCWSRRSGLRTPLTIFWDGCSAGAPTVLVPGVIVTSTHAGLRVDRRTDQADPGVQSGGRCCGARAAADRAQQGIISVAPVLGAAVTVYVLALALVPGFVGLGELKHVELAILYVRLPSPRASPRRWPPSRADLRAGLVAFVAISVLIGLVALDRTGLQLFDFLLGEEFERIRGIVVFWLIVLTTLTAAAAAAYGVLQRTTRQGARYVSILSRAAQRNSKSGDGL